MRYPVAGWKDAVARLSRATRTAFAAGLGQIAIKAQAVVFPTVEEAVDRLGADPDQAGAVRREATGNLLRRPIDLQSFDH